LNYKNPPQTINHPSDSYINCKDLFKIFKRAELEVVALRGVDLAIERGEMVAIVGASGSGKSTLLNMLSALDRPSAGQIYVGNRDLLNISERDSVLFRRSEVGFVWQATARNLIPYLNARDNIEIPMSIAGTKPSLIQDRSSELLSILGLKDKSTRFAHELSGGEQQRLAIAVAMSNNPQLLLADEPTGELDNLTALEVFSLFRHINQVFGVTVVMVTHHPGIANHMDRVLHIRDGRISSESSLSQESSTNTNRVLKEYLVVDQVGRLQIPQEYMDSLDLEGLAQVDLLGNELSIKPLAKGVKGKETSS
jgi:ABC-type lipoprotein export system ATPase subunit